MAAEWFMAAAALSQLLVVFAHLVDECEAISYA